MGQLSPSGCALSLDEAVISYGPRATIGPVSAEIGPGSVLGLVGTNGSGKTSLMRAICALEPVCGGRIAVFGEAVRVGQPVVGVGAMIEEPRFYPWLSGRENLLFAAAGRPEWSARIATMLERVALTSVSEVAVGEYSQGMRQRLGLARAMLGAPSMLVLDEPTNGLDPDGIRLMRELLGSLVADQQMTVVISSHLLSEIEQMSVELLALSAGRVLVSARTADVVAEWGSVGAMYDHAVSDGRR